MLCYFCVCFVCVCVLFCHLVVLVRLSVPITYNLLTGTLNPTHSLTHSLTHLSIHPSIHPSMDRSIDGSIHPSMDSVNRYQNVSILDFTGAEGEEGGGDNWSYKTCKAPVKMSPTANQHPVSYRSDALPVAQAVQPSLSKH